METEGQIGPCVREEGKKKRSERGENKNKKNKKKGEAPP